MHPDVSHGGKSMLKAASLTLRVKPDTRSRLDNLAHITRRSKSFVIEDHEEVLAKWEAKVARSKVA